MSHKLLAQSKQDVTIIIMIFHINIGGFSVFKSRSNKESEAFWFPVLPVETITRCSPLEPHQFSFNWMNQLAWSGIKALAN